MLLQKEYVFNSKVRIFEIEGIKMVGNLVNGSIVGVDLEGAIHCRTDSTKSSNK